MLRVNFSSVLAHTSSNSREMVSLRNYERGTGFEPATSSLARKRSTTELPPLRHYAPQRKRTYSLLSASALDIDLIFFFLDQPFISFSRFKASTISINRSLCTNFAGNLFFIDFAPKLVLLCSNNLLFRFEVKPV